MLLRLSLLILLLNSTAFAEELTLERAIQNTLKLQADIIYSKLSSDASKSVYEGTRGPFDNTLTSRAEIASTQTPYDGVEKKLYKKDLSTVKSQTYNIQLSKLTRSGVGVQASANLLTSNDIAPDLNQPRESTPTIGVAINFPIYDLLMENRNTTNEKIALEKSKASLNDYFFQASTSVYQTVVNYWNYLASYEQLLIYKKSEQITQKMLLDFQKLVEKGERPRADSNQIKANLADKQARVVTGEKDLVSKGYELAKSMGVPYEDVELSPPKIQWVKANDPGKFVVDEFIQNAYEKRFDIKSTEIIMRSAELMLESSKRGLKPDLNVYASAYASDKSPHVSGNVISNAGTFTAGISFTQPLENSSAKSDVIQKEIALRQMKLNLANVKRKAGIDVASSLNELKQSMRAYEYSLKTENLYQEALKVEGQKLKLGMSTVLDVINTHESYQNALASKIENLRIVAISLAGVVYDTGEMLSVDGDKILVNMPALYSLSKN